MRIGTAAWMAAFIFGFGASAVGQTPVVTMQLRTPGNVSPGTFREVDVFINNIAGTNFLRGYQIGLQILPQSGSAGSVTLAAESAVGVYKCLGGTNAGGMCTVANSTADCPGGGRCSGSAFTDESRTDYVFRLLGTVTAAFPGLPVFGATLLDSGQSVQASTPKYIGTYILQASATASGNFLLRVDPDQNTSFLIDKFSPETLIPFTSTNFTFSVVLEVANDDCVDGAAIVDGVTPFDTENAATDGPSHAGTACDVGGSSTISNDVWYNYFSSCTGILTVSTCGSADFDTRIAVYNTCTCPISGNANLIGCSDDGVGCTGGTSEVVTNATVGNCYKIRLGGDPGQTGTGNLKITCVPNDTCATATALFPPTTIQGSTISANLDSGPACGPTLNASGVWYSVQGTGGLLTASVCGNADYDSRITVFSGSACGALSCVGNANNTCGQQESIGWCSTLGTQYFILVSGNSNSEGSFSLNVTAQSCDDGNTCTTDSCTAGACVNTNNFDPVTDCCNRNNGALSPLDDANPCTLDVCNSFTGVVTHPPAADGDNPACDDGEGCTVDRCASGACQNIDVETLNIPCNDSDDCPGDSLCAAGGVCLCGATLELNPKPSVNAVPSCFEVGNFFTVLVDMTAVAAPAPLVGAQVFLHYDTSTLDFVSIEPGDREDPLSPFTFEFAERVDTVQGHIDYLVGMNFGGQGTLNPAVLAVATFLVIAECEPFVEFRNAGPNGELNQLTDADGQPLIPGHLFDTPSDIRSDSSTPVLSGCPASQTLNPDPGLFTATVTWATPGGVDGCDGPTGVICNPPSGHAFPVGTTNVICSSTDTCELTGSCSFNVTVRQPTVTVDVQLSANVMPGPFNRCITFDVWDCVPGGAALHSTVTQTIPFSSGQINNVVVPIPGGNWECITAKDALHTLRSKAPDFTTSNGFQYTASFLGPRESGGHWLLGGNLNNDNFIDILDFAIFMGRFLTPSNANAPCGTPSPNANINGDAVVDLIDFVFVQVNSLEASEPNCCASVTAEEEEMPIMSITVAELRRRGLGELRVADLNEDGNVDTKDISAFLAGVRPRNNNSTPPKAANPDRNLRDDGRK